jgi:hypothetical protein
MSSLPRAHLSILTSLHEAGGAGRLDPHGRVQVGPTRHPLPGDTVAWLVLVAAGMVAGENGQLILTQLGRDTAQGILAGRVRDSAS